MRTLSFPLSLLLALIGLSAGCDSESVHVANAPEPRLARATTPSDARIELDRLVYGPGDLATATLDLGGTGSIEAPNLGHALFVASKTGDVEAVSFSRVDGQLVASIRLEAESESTVNDGSLRVEPGEPFHVLHYFDRKQVPAAAVSEDMVFDFALVRGAVSAPAARVLPELAWTDDETTGRKASGTLVRPGAPPVQIATRELILYASEPDTLERFEKQTGAVLLREGIAEDDTGIAAHLVSVEPRRDFADLALLRAFLGEEGELIGSRDEALGIYERVLELRLQGWMVAVNPRLQWQGAPAISESEQRQNTFTMKMRAASAVGGPCVPHDSSRACLTNVPAVWAHMALWDFDLERINLAVLDIGFAPNEDFRRPLSGELVQCDMSALGEPDCGPGRAEGPPTVGNSLFGNKTWHGTGVVTTAGGVINNGFGASGVGGQVVVPMLYKYDLASYAFEIGGGIRRAVRDDASCINISGGYPCNILTNVGPDFDICTGAGRAGICALVFAGASAAAGAVCAAAGVLGPFAPIACGAAASAVAASTSACAATLAFGDLRSPMASAVRYARREGVPVIASAGNTIDREKLPEVIRDIVNLADENADNWGEVPAALPDVISVGAVGSDFTNIELHGDSIDVWAPIRSSYMSPSDVEDPSSPLVADTIGGTSAAAPYISGLVAAMQASNPELDPKNPALDDVGRRAIVDRIRRILTNPDNLFTDDDLVSFGLASDTVRRNLINPLAVIEEASAGVPDLAAMSYDRSLNFSELFIPDDQPENARTLEPELEETGTILSIPSESDTPTARDRDWFMLDDPGLSGRLFRSELRLTYPGGDVVYPVTDPETGVSAFRVIGRGGAAETRVRYEVLQRSGEPVRFALIAQDDNVYKVAAGAPELLTPEVEISIPETVCAGEPTSIDAIVSYPDAPAERVPSSAVSWRIDGVETVAGSLRITPSLTEGEHTIEASLFGERDPSAVSTLTAASCVGTPPSVSIWSIPDDPRPAVPDLSELAFGTDANGSYVELTLTAAVSDPDEAIPDSEIVWTSNRADLQPGGPTVGVQELGRGRSVTVRIYTNCTDPNFGLSDHEIRVRATDEDGQSDDDVRLVRVETVC